MLAADQPVGLGLDGRDHPVAQHVMDDRLHVGGRGVFAPRISTWTRAQRSNAMVPRGDAAQATDLARLASRVPGVTVA